MSPAQDITGAGRPSALSMHSKNGSRQSARCQFDGSRVDRGRGPGLTQLFLNVAKDWNRDNVHHRAEPN
jgi:hypothetical protein